MAATACGDENGSGVANVTETIYDPSLAPDPGFQVGQFALELNPQVGVNDLMGSATFVGTDTVTVIKDIGINVNKAKGASITCITQNTRLEGRPVLMPEPASAGFLLAPVVMIALRRQTKHADR